MKVLVVDDDPQIVSLLRRGLSYEGYEVDTALDGVEGLQKAQELGPDIVVLDLLMPGMDGLEVARAIRRKSHVPILMLTAKGTVPDKVIGLDAGADDYMVKPFDFDEMLARVRALLRRRETETGQALSYADINMDTTARQVTRAGRVLELTAREFDLLEFFLRHPGQVLRRAQIYDKVWGYDFAGESNIIEVYVRYLRAKLEEGGAKRLIRTVRGVGYVLRE